MTNAQRDSLVREYANLIANADDGFYIVECQDGNMQVRKQGDWYVASYKGMSIPFTSAAMLMGQIFEILGDPKTLMYQGY